MKMLFVGGPKDRQLHDMRSVPLSFKVKLPEPHKLDKLSYPIAYGVYHQRGQIGGVGLYLFGEMNYREACALVVKGFVEDA